MSPPSLPLAVYFLFYPALYSLVSFDLYSFARRGRTGRDRDSLFLLSLLFFSLPHKCSSRLPLLFTESRQCSSSSGTRAERTLRARSRYTRVHPSECARLCTTPRYGPVPTHTSTTATSAANVLPRPTTRRCSFPSPALLVPCQSSIPPSARPSNS